MGWEEAWAELDEVWRRACALAWEAFVEGSIAVGAVVVGPDGSIVAEGRNRAAGADPIPGQLVGCGIAHAEVNALGLVPRGLVGTTLLTTLEPCFMCTTTARFALVGEVRYAAPDPVWEGADRIAGLNAFYARWDPARVEVDLGPLSTWCGGIALLAVARWVAGKGDRTPADELADGYIAATIRSVQPAAVDLATTLLADGLEPGTDLSLEQALARWWPAIAGDGTPG